MQKYIQNHIQLKLPSYKTILFTLPIVLIWRGVWGIADLLLVPENKSISYILGIGVGMIAVVWFKIPNVSTVEEINPDQEKIYAKHCLSTIKSISKRKIYF